MQKLNISVVENQLKQMESYLPNCESINAKISKANVAWHLDHNLKVINSVVKVMHESDPNLYKDNFSFLGKVLLNLKEIDNLDKNAHFKHPLFGNVNKARVLTFLKAHTNHHLKIVKSILK